MIRKSALLASAGLMAVATPAFAQSGTPSTETGKPENVIEAGCRALRSGPS